MPDCCYAYVLVPPESVPVLDRVLGGAEYDPVSQGSWSLLEYSQFSSHADLKKFGRAGGRFIAVTGAHYIYPGCYIVSDGKTVLECELTDLGEGGYAATTRLRADGSIDFDAYVKEVRPVVTMMRDLGREADTNWPLSRDGNPVSPDKGGACVILESPFAGEVEVNQEYLEACIRDSILRGESPYASHRMLPGALDDEVPEERAVGVAAADPWRKRADYVVVYYDRGFSPGMLHGILAAMALGLRLVFRTLGGRWSDAQPSSSDEAPDGLALLLDPHRAEAT